MHPDDSRAIVRRFRELEAQIERLKRQIGNVVREGRVTEVDFERGLAEVQMDGLASRMIPFVQRAGSGVKDWDPPSAGERVVVLSPTGDPAKGLVMPGGWSDDNPAPDNRGGNRTIVVENDATIRAGGTITLEAGEEVRILVGETLIRLHEGGIEIAGEQIPITGARVEHNGLDIGATHKHRDVMPGTQPTGIPLP